MTISSTYLPVYISCLFLSMSDCRLPAMDASGSFKAIDVTVLHLSFPKPTAAAKASARLSSAAQYRSMG